MKRRVFSILFALVLVLSFSLVTAVPAAAADTWYVDPTGTDDPAHGKDPGTDAFQTITYAISQAGTDDTINVAAGIYQETIDVTVDGLTIQSVSGDPSDTIIDANGADHTVVSILSNNVIFSGFTITGAIGLTYADYSVLQGNSGVYMDDAEGCHLSNLIIDDIRRETPGWGNGILVHDSCHNTFESITISNIAGGPSGGVLFGILLRGDVGGSHHNSFTDITIDTITLENTDPNFSVNGIQIWGVENNDNTFDMVKITNLEAPQAAVGIDDNNQRNSFTSTEISFIHSPKAYGILLWGTVANDAFEGTTISNLAGGEGRARGIFLYLGCHDNSFTSTNISGLTGATAQGIFAYGGAHHNSFNGGSILGAKHGVYIQGDCPSNSIHFANIVGNTEYGAYSDTVTLDATNNWWGDASGPEDAVGTKEAPEDYPCAPVAEMKNVNGLGNKVGDNVDYCPWLGEGYAPTKSGGTATGTGTASFSPDSGALENLTAVDEDTLPTEGKPDLVFPHGFFSFSITGLSPGQTVTVTITLPSAVPVGTQYWKYHKSEGGWIQIPMGSDDGDNVITITLVDGGLGDDDVTADGVIVDQGGPGSPPPPLRAPPPRPAIVGGEVLPVDKVSLLMPWIGLAVALALVGAFVARFARRKVRG